MVLEEGEVVVVVGSAHQVVLVVEGPVCLVGRLRLRLSHRRAPWGMSQQEIDKKTRKMHPDFVRVGRRKHYEDCKKTLFYQHLFVNGMAI